MLIDCFTLSLIRIFIPAREMRNIVLASVFLTLVSCKTQDQKLQISPIYAEPKKLITASSEDGKEYLITSLTEVTQRLQPLIAIVSQNKEKLKLHIQGNISSAGLSIQKIRKIRFEETKSEEDSITLKYMVEIKKIPGKESANIRGYNYEQEMNYEIPKGIKYVKLELYEDYAGNRVTEHPKLVFEKLLLNHSKKLNKSASCNEL